MSRYRLGRRWGIRARWRPSHSSSDASRRRVASCTAESGAVANAVLLCMCWHRPARRSHNLFPAAPTSQVLSPIVCLLWVGVAAAPITFGITGPGVLYTAITGFITELGAINNYVAGGVAQQGVLPVESSCGYSSGDGL